MKVYRVKSDTELGVIYTVRFFEETGKWTCECKSYAFGSLGFECKHVLAIKKQIKEKESNE